LNDSHVELLGDAKGLVVLTLDVEEEDGREAIIVEFSEAQYIVEGVGLVRCDTDKV
jgi:hypothetical protein